MTAPILEIQGLTKSFGVVPACRNVTLNLRPGEIHALIGPNGAGKSTLIGLTAGTITADAGRIRLDGVDITDLGSVGRARRGLGRTFQISSLAMEHTVQQNAMLGVLGRTRGAFRFLRSAMKDDSVVVVAMEALLRVGLAEKAGVRTAELSHGERRQLEVAVALTLSPHAFLMDEPMAGLGIEGSKLLTAFLDQLRTEAPILLVEHDMDAVFTLADRISVLVYGEVIATGTANEIRADATVRTAYLGGDA